jgi:fermentation-respiration switch protein FrsA (DUF1100 family)
VKLSDADMKKLAEKLAAVKNADSGKSEGARKEFAKEFDRVDKVVKPALLISMWETWNEIFYMIRTLPKAPSGLGRVEEKSVSATHAGKPVEFKYGLILPNGFDVKKKYPLIVALHDKGASKDDKITGVKYLQDVWMDTKTLPKEERDKFIIIAPTMGPGAAGKEYRVEWGDILHIKSVYLPMLEMLEKYPVDNERIYLDGAGEGGEFALQLGLFKPHAWAAVAARSALPRTLQLLQNGGSLPISVHLRTGTPVQTGQPRQNFDHQVQTLGLPAELKEYPASDKPYRGGFANDPLNEATAAIVAFFGQKTRVLYPKKLTFTTDTSIFKEAYWIRLIKHESGDQHFAKISGSVDPGENLIDLTTEGIEEFKIYLSDRLLDLSRPVKVNVNGRPHTERQFTRDLDVFLNYYVANPIDPALQPCAFLELKVAATESRPESKPEPPQPPKPPK